jgi:hypothetical protein
MSTNPTTSTAEGQRSWEFIAIPMVLVLLGLLALIMLAMSSGLWAWLAVGVIFLTALVTVALLSMRRPHHPSAWSAGDGAAAHVDDGVHRVLLIADDTCDPKTLGAAIAAHGKGGPTAVHVVAPALGSRTARWTSDEHAYQSATEHLDATLKALTDLHIDAQGHIGAHDPLQAVDDGLREFAADEILFAVHPSDAANWLELGVVDAARTRYPIPVSELAVECTGEPAFERDGEVSLRPLHF